MEKVYVFGHRKPDTDSVTSAISLAYLKRQQGLNANPYILGKPNEETKFVLNYFSVKQPDFLNDVKLQLKDINYYKGLSISDKASINDCYLALQDNVITGIPVVNENNKFKGLITIKNLARYFIDSDLRTLNTSYNNILKVVGGEEVLKFNDEIGGNLKIASFRSTTFIEKIILNNEDILIVGDRHSIIEYAVESSIKLIIVVGNGEIKEKHLEIAKQNKVNIIRTNYDTLHTAKVISLCNYISTILEASRPISFEETDFLDDFLEITNKLKHTNYPIVDSKDNCLGLIRLSAINEKKRKKVILVDHNEKSQSIEGLDEAEILEVVDHHNISSITTSAPVDFRCMAVGSTNTIVYKLFRENKVEIPKDIAGLMLSGILSDTLLFKSPTTTDLDKETATKLAAIAEVNIEKYGMEMLKAGTSIKGKSIEDVIHSDFKNFTIGDDKIGIGQVMTLDFDDIKNHINEYIEELNETCSQNNLSMAYLFITDIINEGSFVLYSEKGKKTLEIAYMKEDIEQGYYFKGIVSRKKQIVPPIMEVLDNK